MPRLHGPLASKLAPTNTRPSDTWRRVQALQLYADPVGGSEALDASVQLCKCSVCTVLSPASWLLRKSRRYSICRSQLAVGGNPTICCAAAAIWQTSGLSRITDTHPPLPADTPPPATSASASCRPARASRCAGQPAGPAVPSRSGRVPKPYLRHRRPVDRPT